MGILFMKREHEFSHKGYPYGTDILYVYCDKCGSFSVKTYLSIRKWLIIIVNCVLISIFVKYVLFLNSNWFLCFLFFCTTGWIVTKYGWGDKNYKCRKCGNADIIINHPKAYASEIPKYNTLDYPSDMEILDVPDHLTQKRYQGYWSDEYR